MWPRLFKRSQPTGAGGAASRDWGPQLEQARAHYQNGQLAESTAICRVILGKQPDHADSLMLLAEILTRQNDVAEAIEIYSRAIESQSDNAVAFYKRGNLLKDCGQLEVAVASSDQAVTVYPGYSYAF